MEFVEMYLLADDAAKQAATKAITLSQVAALAEKCGIRIDPRAPHAGPYRVVEGPADFIIERAA